MYINVSESNITVQSAKNTQQGDPPVSYMKDRDCFALTATLSAAQRAKTLVVGTMYEDANSNLWIALNNPALIKDLTPRAKNVTNEACAIAFDW